MQPALCLLVLRVGDLGRARGFYGALGFDFVEEQHGSGPRHLAAVTDSLVLELYPASARFPVVGQRLGIRLAGEAAVCLRRLQAVGAEILEGPRSDSADGAAENWALVRDPDGHRVELYFARAADPRSGQNCAQP